MQKIVCQKDTILFKAGDTKKSLYRIIKGELMVCTLSGSMVTPLAYLKSPEFVGELAFFDDSPRSAYVVAMEDSELEEISSTAIATLPPWLVTLAKNLSSKIRNIDEVIRNKGIKRKQSSTLKALTIEQQRHYYLLLSGKE